VNHVLLRPFAYLSITHGSSRLPVLNWALPLLSSCALIAGAAWIAPSINVFHAGGVIDKLVGFIQTLPGFYLAALAAVATFGREGLDQLMPGTPPRVRIVYKGALREVELTRRRMLTMMFSYLTALSISLTLFGIGGLVVVDQVSALLADGLRPMVRVAAAFAFLVFTAQMIVITMWGLYYLGERMHTPD
jgi:hypothetical protein